jgi:DNA-binding MarR family transcriptional regulator
MVQQEGSMTEKKIASDELLKKCERILWRTLPSVLHANRKLSLENNQNSPQLTPAQYHILRNIDRGANSISDLADCERVSLPAISRHVDDLVKQGLVKRTRDSADRRAIILALTEKGQTVWNKMVERNHQIFSDKMQHLSIQEVETIIKGLELLYSAFANQPLENNCEADGEKHHYA